MVCHMSNNNEHNHKFRTQLMSWQVMSAARRGLRACVGSSAGLCVAFLSAAVLFVFLSHVPALKAGPLHSICIQCSGPDKTYRCEVETKKASNKQALQLYCVINAAKDGGHRSCSARKNQKEMCDGRLLTYRYNGPVISPAQRLNPAPRNNEAAPSGEFANTRPQNAPQTTPLPAEEAHDLSTRSSRQSRKRSKEPETLIELTDEAVKNSGKQIDKAGKAVSKAAKNTTNTVGKIAKDTGQALQKTTERTGRNINNAARRTYNCIRSFFRNC